MKIDIESREHNLHLRFPTRLLCSKMIVRIADRLGRKYAAEHMKNIPPEALEKLCAELRKHLFVHSVASLILRVYGLNFSQNVT